MGTTILTIIVAIAVLAGAALLFGGWVLWSILRLAGRVITAVLGPLPVSRGRRATGLRCSRPNCGAPNPARARFCRRCGAPLREGRERLGWAATL
jgi:ribosomal protein L40E